MAAAVAVRAAWGRGAGARAARSRSRRGGGLPPQRARRRRCGLRVWARLATSRAARTRQRRRWHGRTRPGHPWGVAVPRSSPTGPAPWAHDQGHALAPPPARRLAVARSHAPARGAAAGCARPHLPCAGRPVLQVRRRCRGRGDWHRRAAARPPARWPHRPHPHPHPQPHPHPATLRPRRRCRCRASTRASRRDRALHRAPLQARRPRLAGAGRHCLASPPPPPVHSYLQHPRPYRSAPRMRPAPPPAPRPSQRRCPPPSARVWRRRSSRGWRRRA